MKHRWVVFLFMAAVVIAAAVNAQAFIVINEVLADPPAGLAGDANNDGVGSTTQDEFIELYNNDASNVDVSGWSIKDAVQARHIFALNSIIPAKSFLVVFGGGAPNLPGVNWKLASTGTLSLNNTNETVGLYNQSNALIDQIIYAGEGNHDQSLVRSPEGSGAFILHTAATGANGKKYSPGTLADGSVPQVEAPVQAESSSVVPELPAWFYVGSILPYVFWRHRNSFQRS